MKKILLLAASMYALLSVNYAESSEKKPEQSKQTKKMTSQPVVKIATSMGDITVELNAEKAPITVKNFLSYVEDDFFNDTVFHRIIKNFMIQGGGMVMNGNRLDQKDTKAPIPIESSNGLKNDRGTIAMARTGDPNSATSQFFINVVDNTFLNYPGQDGHGYCVFGKVTSGMDIVDEIKAVKTKAGDEPITPVTIKSISLLDEEK